MTRIARFLVPPLVAWACSSAQVVGDPDPADRDPARRVVGDFVEYRFTGAYTPAPVTVVQEVAAMDGARIDLRFTATRGDERRTWIQTVTPVAGEGGGEVVERVVAVSGSERRTLDLRDPRAVSWLYEWTIARVKGLPEDVDTEPTRETFAGATWQCTAETGELKARDSRARFRFVTCPDFPWTVGPGRITGPDDRVIWDREVVRAGSGGAGPGGTAP